MSYIAFQYAEALFALAHEEKQVESVLESFNAFVSAQDAEIYKFLNHPKIINKVKKEVLSTALTNSLFKNFVFVLIDNSRIDYLNDCLDEYKIIVDAQNKVMNVFVYSSKKLTKIEAQELVNNLSKKHNRKVKLENIVEKTILGGLRIEFEGNILDETINSYLASLRNNLTK